VTRRYAILAPDRFATDAKTAHGVIAYGNDTVVAVIDPTCAGKRVRDVLPHLHSDAPIVAGVADALRYEPNALLIGTAPKGGALPPDWRTAVLDAIGAKLEIVSGLHDMLGDDPEFARETLRSGTTIWDVRKPPEVPLFSGDVYGVAAPILLLVGNDCAVGKMTVALELVRAANDAGTKARFVPTGQTGIMIAGWGVSIDRVIADFAAGATEQLVLHAASEGAELIVVEGQGAINHPAYAPVTLALMYGAAPDALVLVCEPRKTTIESFHTPALGYRELVRIHEALLATVKPARVAGIALNTRGLSDGEAREEIARATDETKLPADDVVRFGAARFYGAILPQFVKRAALVLAVVLGLAFASTGCTQQHADQSGGNARHSWTIPGVLRLGEDQEPDSLNLMYANNTAADSVSGLLFSFLLRYDPDGNYVPDLATVVPTTANGGISADGMTIVVHLRKNAFWADGVRLTAADWLFTYRAVMNPANNVKSRYGWDVIASAIAPDPYTIRIRLKRPSVEVFGILAMGGVGYPPLPAHVLAALPNLNRAPFNSNPLSSGPYVLKAWSHGASLEFVPNPRYFRGAPQLDEVIWKIVPDVNTLFTQLRTHEIDVYPGVNANAVPRLSDISGIVVNHRLTANWRHLGINMSNPLLADVRVRQAIALAVDWKRINDTVYHGINRLAVSDIYPDSWAAPTLPPYRYDPGGARKLLAAAGWSAGADGVLHKGPAAMHVTISASTGHMENDQSELLIQSMLRAVGIDIAIRNYSSSLLFAQDGPIYTGKYDLEWSIDTNGAEPDNSGIWNAAFIPPNGANTSWLNDPIVNETSAAAASTFDQAKRKVLYQREEERIRELVPAVFFAWSANYTAMNTDVKNYIPGAFIGDTWNAWQWQI
jgi:peptide/nickel transport system substrate-binding protein